MKSNECKLTNSVSDLDSVFTEVEKCAVYANLNEKEALRLRLLSEEMVDMLPALLSYGSGEFWVEATGKSFELHVSLVPEELSSDTRERLLSVSSSGKNAAAVGILNKIRIAAEIMMLDYIEATDAAPVNFDFFSLGVSSNPSMYSTAWSLNSYRDSVKKEKSEEWDELEKSIIANLSDDVLVGIKGNQVDIIAKKQF